MAKSRYVVIKETIGDIADESVSRNNNLRNFVFDIRGRLANCSFPRACHSEPNLFRKTRNIFVVRSSVLRVLDTVGRLDWNIIIFFLKYWLVAMIVVSWPR
jgi:hypothetical protein